MASQALYQGGSTEVRHPFILPTYLWPYVFDNNYLSKEIYLNLDNQYW